MFDLIEEDLQKEQQPAEQSEAIPAAHTGEIVVSVMPERFRPEIKKKKKGSFAMIAIIALFVLIAIASIVALIVLSQPQKKVEESKQSPSDQQQEAEVVQTPEQSAVESATSTPPIEAPFQQPVSPGENAPTPPSQGTQSQSSSLTPPSASTATPPLTQGVDSDGDGLTDSEERLFSTDPQKPDSDGDGFFDGEELKKLFDPTRPSSARLDTSVLAHSYSNKPFKYRIYYPAAWVAKAVNTTEREVIFTSATGEFISLMVEDNSQGLSPLDWYITTKNPGINPAQLQALSSETWTGVTSSDGRTIYFARKSVKGTGASAPLTYSLTYNLNTKNEVNFLATFQMMITSFTFTDLTFVK